METKDLAKLREEQGQSFDILSKNISTQAKAICDRRKEKANAVEKSVNSIESIQKESKEAIRTIKSKLNLIIDCEEDTKNRIRQQCDAINKLWEDYHQEASDLAERFMHEKIKIVTYGTPAQGKSTFVHLLTGLPKEVIGVHPDNDAQEKTGAVNIFHYDPSLGRYNPNLDNGEYRIHVKFKTSDQFMKKFVDALNRIKIIEFCGIKTEELTIHDVKKQIGKECTFKDAKGNVYKINSANNDSRGFKQLSGVSAKFIKHMLDKQVNIDELDTIGKDIDVSQIPIYNDIQNNGRRSWMAVEQIDIYANFGDGEMFRYFDVCDTMGFGVDVGGPVAAEETFSELANCDAAFSIVQVSSNNTNIYSFYDDKITPFSDEHTSFRERDFLVSNKFNGTTRSTVEDFIKTIDSKEVVATCYDGELKDEKNKSDEQTPREFVRRIMLDMLGNIVNLVEKEDNRLMENCNRFAAEIQASVAELNRLLHSFTVEDVNVDNILLNKIQDLAESADKKLLESFYDSQRPKKQNNAHSTSYTKPQGDGLRNDGGNRSNNCSTIPASEEVSYTEKKYLELLNSNPDALSVFQLLTGDKDEGGKYRQKSVNDAIEAAVEYLLQNAKESVKKTVGKIPKGNSNDIGRYIDAISDYYRKTFDDRAGQRVPQSVIDTKQIKNEIISVAWNSLHFDTLLGSFDKSVLEKYEYNIRIRKLLEAYNKDAWDSGEGPFEWIVSYDVLNAYFSLKPTRGGTSYLEYAIDEKVLKKAIAQCLNPESNNFIKFLIDRGVDIRKRIKDTVYDYTYKCLLDFDSQPIELLPLYKSNIEKCVKLKILPEGYEKRINQSDAKSEMDGKLEQLSHLVVPLVQ